MQKLIVDKKFDNKKVSEFIFSKFNGLTKNTLYKAFRKKDIRINNVKISEDMAVHLNDVITIYIVDDLLYKNIKIPKVYEDDNILIVDKPSNIEVVGSDSVTSILEKEYSFISPCHRLDRNTTGLLLFAKNKESLSILLNKFKSKEIEKHYLAKVYNVYENFSKANLNFKQYNKKSCDVNNKKTINLPMSYKTINNISSLIKEGLTQTLTAYLFKDNKKSLVYISDIPKKGYVKIETSFTVLEKNKKENYYLLDVELHTGKTHQIRAHLAHIGLPIIGDGKYGINDINKKFGCKTQQLCSYKLKFNFITDAGILNYLNGKEIQLGLPE